MKKDPGRFVRERFDQAIKNQDIKVYYQPEVRALTGRICGFEALARWIDPVEGMISPGEFIPELEAQGRIHELDLYMIRQVCAGQQRIERTGLTLTRTSVNLSRLDFEACDIFSEVEAIRQEYRRKIGYLNIEITESAFSRDDRALAEGMKKFREAGYQVWMDDFGSGYSSLNNLKDYTFDLLKIDMEFLRDFEKKPQSKVILAAIVNMAKQLGIHTLAEGVETQAQVAFLRDIGCEKLQGYYVGRPAPMDEDIMSGKKEAEDIEDATEDAYYGDIGSLNVLSYFPLQDADSGYDIVNSQKLSILELNHEGHFRYLYCNKAYTDFLRESGFRRMEDSLICLNDNPGGTERNFRHMLLRCGESGKLEGMDCVLAGNVCNIKCRLLAENTRTGCRTYGIVLTNFSDFTLLHQADDIHRVLCHMISVYNRVDLFTESGMVENIYLESLQGRITDDVHHVSEVLERYAKSYIVSEERQAFYRFYDLDTVEDRAARANKDHVTGFFHSYDESGRLSLQMYLLIPFIMDGRKMILSCVRDIDGVGMALPEDIMEIMEACQ